MHKPKLTNSILPFLGALFLSIGLHSQEPQIWLKADDTGNEENVWKDVSGNNNNAYSLQTINNMGLINFNASIQYDSISDTLAINYDIANKEYVKIYTVFVGVPDTCGYQYIWSFGNINRQSLELSNKTIYNYPNTYKYTGGTVSKPIISIVDRYNSNNATDRKERFFLGNSFEDSLSSGSFSGEIAEIIVYDSEQETETHYGIESYLAIKYGICLNKDYYNSNGDIIWNLEDNEDYEDNVFALGRNDDFGLYQKQATAANSNILAIGANTLEEKNSANLSSLKDDSYMFFSDNGEESNEGLSIELGAGGSYYLSNQKWKVNTEGSGMSQIPLVIKVLSDEVFDTLTGDFYLIKDANMDGNFSEIETINVDSISSDGYAYFSDISFCLSKSSQDYFTFAQSSPLEAEITYSAPACDSAFGSASLSITGGTPPFIITLYSSEGTTLRKWESSLAEFSINNLNSDNYTIKIIDADSNCYALKTEENLDVETPDLGINPIYNYSGSAISLNLCNNYGEDSCQWFKENDLISNNCNITISEEGSYNIAVNTGGCLISQQFYVLDNSYSSDTSSSAISSTYNSNTICISPNPALSDFYIDINLSNSVNATIYITDINGVFIENKKLGVIQQYTYHGKIKTPGTYIVLIVSDNEILSKELLIIQ